MEMVGSPAAGTACGLGGVGLGIEAALELLAQFHTGGLLDMGVGVHQHIRTGVSCGPLHRLDVAAGDHQLVAENKQSPQAGYKIRSVGLTISGVIFLCVVAGTKGFWN